MTEQELINALNDTESERARWMTAALTAGNEVAALKEANETWRKQWANSRYEVEQLKAQVNCLREALDKAKDKLSNENIYDNNIRFALQATPEQCLAEVKAKAIEDSMPKIINACVKYSVEKYINTSVEMVSVGQLKRLSEIRHHGEWEQAK